MCNIFIFIYVWKGKERGYIERNVKKDAKRRETTNKGSEQVWLRRGVDD